jgi:hypothetical protein
MPNGFLVKLTSVKEGSSVMFGRGSQSTQDDLDKVTRTEDSTLAVLSKQ